MNSTLEGRRYVGIVELSKYLDLTKGTLYVWTCRKKIPYLKIGGSLKFDLIEIDKWLKDKRIREIS